MRSSTTRRSRGSPSKRRFHLDQLAIGTLAAVSYGCVGDHYDHYRISDDVYKLEVRSGGGSLFVPRPDCNLLYAAQLTRAAGYGYFYAFESERRTRSGGSVTTFVPGGEIGETQTSSGPPYIINTYRIQLLPEMLRLDEQAELVHQQGLALANLFVYDADFVSRALEQEVQLKCPFDPPSPDPEGIFQK